MIWASVRGHIEIVKYLSTYNENHHYEYAMQYTVRNGHLEIVKYLYEDCCVKITKDMLTCALRRKRPLVATYLEQQFKCPLDS